MKLAAVLAVVALAGCKKPAPPAPQIVEVTLVDKTVRAQPVPIDLAALTARAAQAIGQTGGLPITDGGAACASPQDRCYRLRVEIKAERVEEPSSGKGVLRAAVNAELRGPGRSIAQRGLAEHEYEIAKLGDPAAAWRAHLQRAVGDVVSGVGARLKLQSGDGRALAAAVEGADEDLRDEAIQLAAERKSPEAVPALVKLLKSDDHAARDQAIGALAQIGDARAVKPLTEVARFRDLADLPKVLDALAMIGGDEARAYLEFVASGHDNEEIRDLARAALQHLERRHARDMTVAH